MEHTSPKLNWKAVLAGATADFASTIAVEMVLAVVLLAFLARQGLSTLQALEALPVYLSSNVPLLIFIFLGSLCTTLGGFVAAHIARGAELLNAGAVGGAGILLGIVMLPINDQPAWYTVLAFVILVPAALLGGWLRTRMPRSQPTEADEGEAPPLPHPF